MSNLLQLDEKCLLQERAKNNRVNGVVLRLSSSRIGLNVEYDSIVTAVTTKTFPPAR